MNVTLEEQDQEGDGSGGRVQVQVQGVVGDGDGDGGGGKVKGLVKRLENLNKPKVSRVKTPRMGRGIKRDSLIQSRITSLVRI